VGITQAQANSRVLDQQQVTILLFFLLHFLSICLDVDWYLDPFACFIFPKAWRFNGEKRLCVSKP
jgi:hypothetical protein